MVSTATLSAEYTVFPSGVECHKGGEDLSQPVLLVLGLTSGYSVWIITVSIIASLCDGSFVAL